MGRDPAAFLGKLRVPTLVLRGGEDINVTEMDFQELSKAAVAQGSEAKEFSGLNHSFIPVKGHANGYDEFVPRHVSPEVIDTVADWVLQTPKN